MNDNLHINRLLDLASSGKMPHAILLEGENIDLSFSLSKRIIKALFTINTLGKDEKNEIISAKVEKGIHPDVFIIECEGKAKTIGVNKVRELKETLYIKPNESVYKVYVIKDAAALTVQSQNALLKILEEPPGYAVFILICRSSVLLLDTVMSRVQKFFIEEDKENNAEDVFDKSLNIAEAILSKKEISIMEASAYLAKDRKLFKDTANCLTDIFIRAVLAKNGSEYLNNSEKADVYEKIYMNMSEDQMTSIIDLFKYVCFLLDSNVNINLIVSYLSLKLRELAIL